MTIISPWSFFLRIGMLLLLAFFLDNLLMGLSIFLGTMALLPVLFYGRFPFAKAAIWSFVFGILLDSTHWRIPFGFNAFYGIGIVFILQILRRNLRPDSQKRWLIFILFSTGGYYFLLSIFVHPLYYFGGFLSLLMSLALNEICWILFPRESRRIIIRQREIWNFRRKIPDSGE